MSRSAPRGVGGRGAGPAALEGRTIASLPHRQLEPALVPPTAAAQFRDQGFAVLESFATPAEIRELREILTELFDRRAGRDEGAHFDLISDDAEGGQHVLPSIINPNHYSARLRRMPLQARALAVARELLGPTATGSFQHAILKPAREGGATPWHQDEAYRVDPNFVYEQLSIWIPLQDVSLENGCMVYLPKSHLREVMPHRSVANDPRRQAIECIGEFDQSNGVPCPMAAGGATLHHGRTLHFASSNTTATPRYAYILAFETPPAPRRSKRDFYWLREKRTPGLERKQRWRRRGGILVEAGRKARDGLWKSPGRVVFELRRALRAIRALLTDRG